MNKRFTVANKRFVETNERFPVTNKRLVETNERVVVAKKAVSNILRKWRTV
jgi:hypothetical protein